MYLLETQIIEKSRNRVAVRKLKIEQSMTTEELFKTIQVQ